MNNFVDTDSEYAVLGAVIQDERSWIDVRASLQADDFVLMRHRWIYEAFARLSDAGKSIDIVSVRAELRNMGQLEDFGEANLYGLLGAAVDSAHLATYIDTVALHAYRTRLQQTGLYLAELAKQPATNRAELEAAAAALFNGARSSGSEDSVSSIRDGVGQLWDEIEATRDLPVGVSGLALGIQDYDDLTDGLQAESVNLWAGRPGMGKSAGLTNAALNVAERGKRVYLSSLEMDKAQVTRRIMSAKARINGEKLRRGLRPNGMDGQDWSRFVENAGELGKLPIYLDTKKYVTIYELRSRIERMARRLGGLDLIIIDYLQLINADTKRSKRGGDNRNYELDEIARVLKAEIAPIAPVLAAAQLSRAVESRQDKRPMLNDLRDSGALEQHADTVTFLYRDVMYNEATEFPSRLDLILAKNRHGKTGTVYQHFEKSYTRLSDQHTTSIDLRHL